MTTGTQRPAGGVEAALRVSEAALGTGAAAAASGAGGRPCGAGADSLLQFCAPCVCEEGSGGETPYSDVRKPQY